MKSFGDCARCHGRLHGNPIHCPGCTLLRHADKEHRRGNVHHAAELGQQAARWFDDHDPRVTLAE